MSSDLRVLFRTNLSSIDARQIFVDRDAESAAFERAFAVHGASVSAGRCDPVDVLEPRRNVITFYGMGGVGKTTLSHQLQAWASGRKRPDSSTWPDFPHDTGLIHTARLDLTRESGVDLEAIMILLRAALIGAQRRTIAFDLALSRYWSRVHPHENIAEYLTNRGALLRGENTTRLPEALQYSLDEVARALDLQVPGVSLITMTGKALVKALRGRADRKRVLTACTRLTELLEAEPDLETLSYYPYLLAWDCYQQQRQSTTRPVRLVVFVDTFEEANREFERYLQRLVWLMPNVFFVITGRNRLTWADDDVDGVFDWAGPVSWPGLAAGSEGDPRQHLVGALSPHDSDRFLRDRLRQDNSPLIAEDIRERIVANAHGLPLYLDLSVMRYLQFYEDRRPVRPEEFNVEFPGLIARVFRDLGQEERAALRAASLLDAFDVGLLTETAGLLGESGSLRLIDRPLVQFTEWEPWPYHLDELIRSHVAAADHGLDDSWSAHDWKRAAARALRHLGAAAERYTAHSHRAALISCLNQGLRLAHEFELQPGWLVDAAYRFVADHVWEPTLAPKIDGLDTGRPPETPAATLAYALLIICRRQQEHREHTARELTRCLDSGQLPEEAVELLRYYHAECMRDLGRQTESEIGMRALVEANGRMADTAARGLSHVLRRKGRFRELAELLTTRERTATWSRVLGDLQWTQARYEEADAAYAAARDLALGAGMQGEAALSEACRAFALGFANPAAARVAADSARDLLRGINLTWAELQVRNAELLAAAGTGQSADCDEVVAAADRHGLTSIGAYAELARALDGALRRDANAVARARAGVLRYVHGAEFAYLLAIIDFWQEKPGDPAPAEVDWLADVADTARAWRAVLAR
ncbi:hypothetical protein [Amycolatopsis plumensis]|uniref:ATP/GTP-binding protein n=1 Tax=Amycolatopsis plumensis TaxID=236508 RepID=A0ABV5U461_9PSEU